MNVALLWIGVEWSCLHWPKNWPGRQQTDSQDGKVSTQVRFIREKEKVALRNVQGAQKIGSSLLLT
jgi:hypothetical protein